MWNISGAPTTGFALWGGGTGFWQLVYLNDSESMLFVSDVNGSVSIDGPYSDANRCVWYLENGFDGLFTYEFPPSWWMPGSSFDSQTVETALQLNSSAWGPTAAEYFGNESVLSWRGNAAAYYVLGTTWLNLIPWTEGAWVAIYWGCGVPDRSGEQPLNFTSWALNDSPTEFYGTVHEATSCPVNTNANYLITYNQTSVAGVSRGSVDGLRLRIGVGNTEGRGYSGTANSLVTWMTRVSLNTSSGSPLGSADESCPSNATSIADCVAPTAGWYAVLLSSDGYPLDEYPTESNGNQWATPNVFIANNDTLAIVCSANLTGSGDVLSLVGSTAFPQVLGNVTL